MIMYLGVSLSSLVCCCAASNKLLVLFKTLESKSQCLSLPRCVNGKWYVFHAGKGNL